MSRTVTLRVSDDHYAMFRAWAVRDNRPLSNLIETAALRFLEGEGFVSEKEMAGILGDKKLGAKLRKGSKEIRAGKGRLVA